jgi:hypothetical protein
VIIFMNDLCGNYGFSAILCCLMNAIAAATCLSRPGYLNRILPHVGM